MPDSTVKKMPGFLTPPFVTTRGHQIGPSITFGTTLTDVKSLTVVLFGDFKILYTCSSRFSVEISHQLQCRSNNIGNFEIHNSVIILHIFC